MSNMYLDTPVLNKKMVIFDEMAQLALWYYRPVFRDSQMPNVHLDTPVLNKEMVIFNVFAQMALWYYCPVFRDSQMPFVQYRY